jgi:hypothetical protein
MIKLKVLFLFLFLTCVSFTQSLTFLSSSVTEIYKKDTTTKSQNIIIKLDSDNGVIKISDGLPLKVLDSKQLTEVSYKIKCINYLNDTLITYVYINKNKSAIITFKYPQYTYMYICKFVR